MPYDAKAVANTFLDLAERDGDTLTPMKIQKLVYFAHGWNLAIRNEPLIDEPVQAWRWGPVIPSLYHEFKIYGNSPITERATVSEWDDKNSVVHVVAPRLPANDHEAAAIVDRIWEVYKSFSPIQLSNMTHESDTPWRQIVNENPKGVPRGLVIPNDVIRAYFLKMAASRSED
jgi:uncharacterized phage-associated protein